MTQDELKAQVAQAAADYVLAQLPKGAVVGVGTGSTANLFIDALAVHRTHFRGAVSSSEASSARLQSHGIPVLDLNAVQEIPVYVDGADEITAAGHMIKGGGGALTREKIVAAVAQEFVCIADGSKLVEKLGRFPLPVEVVPMARASVMRVLQVLLGRAAEPRLRLRANGDVYMTDNGCEIVDVHGLQIDDPVALECQINQIPGVLTVGLFAQRGANRLLLGTAEGVKSQTFTA